jgi:acyl-CoA synthetase (AMP-forming)/AMP-acid ligase II
VRHAGADPQQGFFTEYLKDPEATAAVWEGGWFHTGDIVRRNAEGDMFFVDRKKNVIRRSGENISAVEVEGVLQLHPAVRAAAVAAVPDALRGDEVMACIVPAAPVADAAALAREVVAWCLTRLAYYKAPGWVAFLDALPLTATNKVQRGEMKALAARLMGGAVDTRGLKRRG